jgi:uncharacterized membrane protein
VADPPQEVLTTVASIAAWKLARYGRDPLGLVEVASEGQRKFKPRQVVQLPVVDGHRDTNDTACPGEHLYANLQGIRQAAKDLIIAGHRISQLVLRGRGFRRRQEPHSTGRFWILLDLWTSVTGATGDPASSTHLHGTAIECTWYAVILGGELELRRLVMMWWHNGWLVLTLAMVAFGSLVALGVFAISRGDRVTPSNKGVSPDHEPLQILAERFARGEIQVDDYHARQDELRVARILSLARTKW